MDLLFWANYRFDEDKWLVIESKLINLLVKFPSVADKIIIIFLENADLIKKNKLKNAIYSIFDRCLMLNQDQELISGNLVRESI